MANKESETASARYDKPTRDWFANHPGAVTTVAKCEECGLYYKTSLRHQCLARYYRKKPKVTIEIP